MLPSMCLFHVFFHGGCTLKVTSGDAVSKNEAGGCKNEAGGWNNGRGVFIDYIPGIL